ncbi:hypothetical protein E3Q08_02297 [Wallemia mellicola]|uniref:DUF4614 domain-containing protein n=1 Tax=Wallemia mellicola TaxID=1708541 RepID=A0AB38MQ04_9BASI|nr:hypothetical protein E3Q16_01955 [Wallemia mellicola]TIC23767.1 hypothetical protein E3Q12_01817 [Wallemia mellicola]TIC35719.1 hypothetical protein E3Q09_01922 [Wallemia mellicola]TIC43493.1 hypothetical protein E3Q08_02297 [Wallemia mellicola]TIC50468.1 hypothetical protein E3Q04_04079 [Wallemia mellicola]
MENDEIRVKAEIEGKSNSPYLEIVDNPEGYHSASSSPSNELNSEDDDDDDDNDNEDNVEDENQKDDNEGEEYVDFSTYIEQSYDNPDKKSQKRKAEDDNMSLQSKHIKSNNMLSSSQRALAAKATEEESPFWPKADIGSDPLRKSRWSQAEQRYFAGSGMGSSKLKELLRIGAAPPSPQVEEAQAAEQKDVYNDESRDNDDVDNTDKENIFDNTYYQSSNKEINNPVNDVQASSSRLISHKPPLRDVPQEAPPGYDQDILQAGKPDVKNYDVIKRMKKCIEDLHIVSLDALMEASGESSQFIDSSAAPFKRLSQIMAEHSRWLETFVKVVEKKKHNEGLLSP